MEQLSYMKPIPGVKLLETASLVPCSTVYGNYTIISIFTKTLLFSLTKITIKLLESDRMEIKQLRGTGIGKRTKYFLPTKNSKFILKAEKECHSIDSGDKYSIVSKSK